MSATLLAPLILAIAAPTAPPDLNGYLERGALDEGAQAFTTHLETNPDDANAQFSLGAIQFLQGVERLSQFLAKHGVQQRAQELPFLRIQSGAVADPEPVSYADYRALLTQFVDDLTRAESTLAQIEGDVKQPVRFAHIRLDLNGDGTASESETLWRIYAAVNPGTNSEQLQQQADQFQIAFDQGDVYWLRGYCHLISALAEAQLAYDGQHWFDHCGHLLFPKAESPYPFLAEYEPIVDGESTRLAYRILDAITAIHLLDFKLKEPKRLASVRDHLLQVTALSRQSWDAIIAETDNEAEWIPNPNQQSVIDATVSEEMIDSWRKLLDETDALLNGEKLLPFWRNKGQGINVKRVFTEPRDFDAILWLQGTAAAPYLEEGDLSNISTWQQITQPFGTQFGGFALWFN